MGEIPSTINQTATTVNKVISVAGNTIVTVVEGLIVADVPFLNLPVIKPLWQAFFNWIAGYFVHAAKLGATFSIIDSQVDAEVEKLSVALAAVKAVEKTGDPDAIKKAIKAFADAHSALVHSDGSTRIE